jgi:HEAT repeat protein
MRKTRYVTCCIALAAAAVVTAAMPARAATENERALIAILQSDAPKKDKAITCKKLAVFGSQQAVPALAALLPDKELTSWARIALEAIPGPAADKALREALGKVQGRVLIGVINSIGVRRDANAVDGLKSQLHNNNAQVAAAAALALGRIGNPPATRVLAQSLASAPGDVRSAVAEGCVLCAERLLADGKAKAAVRLYDKVRKADVPKQRVVEATRGAILARQPAGIELLVEQLKSTDKVMFALGLTTARELPGRKVTKALAAELDKASPHRQAMLLLTLADRSDDAVLPAVLRVAKSGSGQLRIAAIGVLRRVGNASCVPVLLDNAISTDAAMTEAAKAALEGLPGEDVNPILVARLQQTDGKVRAVLIELAGRRHIAAATPALLKAADDADGQIRAAALTALGSTIGARHLGVLIERIVAPNSAAERQAAEQALRVAAERMPDREACAERLAAGMSQASVPAKCAILDILGTVGGKKALATIAIAAKEDHGELQDAASRLLGQWMTADAAPVLLDLAKTAPTGKYRVRTLRGYIRIAKQFVFADPQRAAMCRAAWQAAERDNEKKLVLEAMEIYPSADMLEVAVEATKDATLKNDAIGVLMAMAQKAGTNSQDVKKLLAQVGFEPLKVEIVKAEYGAGTKMVDVTEALQKCVRGCPLIALPSASYNASFGGDPAPGTKKKLTIRYRIDGQKGRVSLPENSAILLPIPE